MKQILTVLAFLGTLLAAPLASADHYRGRDGQYYEYDSSYQRGYYNNNRRHHRRNNDAAIAAAIIGTGLIIASSNNNRNHRSHRRNSWRDYCARNWRRDPRC
jgi:hypothetical protein